MSKFLLPLAEYNRIHQVIHGVLKEEGRVEKGCTFFAIFGSLVLNKHYGIAARPVAGAFALCVTDEPRCMFYGRDENGKIVWDEDGFHMWVQTETHIIDFMAPIYEEAFAEAGPGVEIPRQMFQKRITDEAASLDDLATPGDFFTLPDPDLSEQLTDRFLSRPTNTDLLQVADAWYGGRRAKQRPSVRMGSNDGIIRQLTLPPTVARGSW